MNKYYVDVKVEMKTSFSQCGDSANELRLIDKSIIEKIMHDAMNSNKELKGLFLDSKPKIKIFIERADEYNGNKNKIDKELVIEGLETYENRS